MSKGNKRNEKNGLQIGNKERRKTKSGVEVGTYLSKRTEKPLHSQVCDVVEDVEGEESTSRSVEVRHKVDAHVKKENPDSRKWHIGKGVRESNGRRTVHAVAGLFVKNRSAKLS